MSAQATSSSIASSAPVAPVVAQSAAVAAESKPKPCCVCKDEKAKRDECMLFSKAADPQKDCLTTIDQYKSCMAGFGFKV
ncbi:cytochrome c oxidase [Triangularia setosa]|uniref:Cytochrome c oxidase n=1 Tax=Triangularia setosa TaxID=2587417 RepID=A0AAN6WI02_9PEZI|nr:cytochrome c oxidase [Podospora setosa]